MAVQLGHELERPLQPGHRRHAVLRNVSREPDDDRPARGDLVNIPYDVNLVNDAGTDADGEPHDKFD